MIQGLTLLLMRLWAAVMFHRAAVELASLVSIYKSTLAMRSEGAMSEAQIASMLFSYEMMLGSWSFSFLLGVLVWFIAPGISRKMRKYDQVDIDQKGLTDAGLVLLGAWFVAEHLPWALYFSWNGSFWRDPEIGTHWLLVLIGLGLLVFNSQTRRFLLWLKEPANLSGKSPSGEE